MKNGSLDLFFLVFSDIGIFFANRDNKLPKTRDISIISVAMTSYKRSVTQRLTNQRAGQPEWSPLSQGNKGH
jgi:hypothetical protein